MINSINRINILYTPYKINTKQIDEIQNTDKILYRQNVSSFQLLNSLKAQKLISFGKIDDIVKIAIENREINKTFVPTPDKLIRKISDIAEIKAGEIILEPSAGQGHIIEYLKSNFGDSVKIDAVEINKTLRKSLKERNINCIAEDILKYNPGEIYDKILMNPPFGKLEFSTHVLHCYNLLKPGGKLVAIIPNPPFKCYEKYEITKLKAKYGIHSAIKNFLKLIELIKNPNICSHFETLPKGIFKTGDISANIDTRLLVLNKPVNN
ncbi:MAG: hypothetical protein PHC34_05355 [Candidatus Gastranaerophilales bacterium]|nr:hypothetical protein [Candidatus Gastranaerophilales bacterium]